MTIGVANPFQPRDDWAVAPDGRVVVVRSPDYHVEWHGAGAPKVGPAIPYDRVKVSESHKAQWRDSRKSQVAVMMTVNNGQRSVATPPASSLPEPTDWPDYMPPFLGGATQVAPDGTIWVLRTGPAGELAPQVDLIDGSGKVTGRVVLPKRTRIVGFGKGGVVYTVRLDDDDLQYLQRFRM